MLKITFIWGILIFLLFVHVTECRREGKIFSLFNIVQFRNGGCRSTATLSSGTSRRNGTCFTSSECRDKGGNAQGGCASGFGVCCVFIITDASRTINQNCTYLQNPGFPSAYADTTSLTYTIDKCSNDVCSLRLDFESFTILGMSSTVLLNEAGSCVDTLEFTVSSGANYPVVCGQNTGQHVYLELGQNSGDSATLDFTFAGSSNQRIWDIKVTQVPCGAISRQPEGCFQYHTGLSGRFTTFNYLANAENHLPNQDYSVCIRQEEGFCCVQYQVCPNEADGFSLTSGNTDIKEAQQDTLCSLDYIDISASAQICEQGVSANGNVDNRYCGPFLNNLPTSKVNAPVCDCTAPFIVDVFTDNLNDRGESAPNDANTASKGVCLEWFQVPCSG